MSFDQRDIRPGMDVYTLDNTYLGTVLAVIARPATATPEQVAATARQSSAVNGELLGPMPTQPIGNPGPRHQSAAMAYATPAPDAQPLGQGAIVVGRWWGLRDRRVIPLEQVQTVALERVVLRQRAAQQAQPARRQA